MKSMLIFVNQFLVMFDAKVMFFFLSKREKKIKRVIKTALKREVKIPIINVVANPLIDPLPKL